jgi:hypothetical protein
MNYRQKLQTVQAFQFTPESREIPDWATSHVRSGGVDSIEVLQKGGRDYDWDYDRQTEYVADDWCYWIVKTPKGKFKVMDDEEFNRKYEPSV